MDMDWQIRIALIIGGFALIGYIFFDFSKKRKIQKENEKLKRQYRSINNQVDSVGFDLDGVGTARRSKVDKESTKLDADLLRVEGASIDEFIAERKEPAFEESHKPENLKQDTSPKQRTNLEGIGRGNENKEDKRDQDLFQKEQTSPVQQQESQLVLSLILQASQGHSYIGKDFLPIFLSQGLRHGDMGIFHRHKKTAAKPGPVLFSLANGIAPGTFSINKIESLETPALALFMTLPGPDDAQIAYDAMVKTIQLLKSEIGGEILDETQSKYTEQTHNHRLDQIQAFNRKMS